MQPVYPIPSPSKALLSEGSNQGTDSRDECHSCQKWDGIVLKDDDCGHKIPSAFVFRGFKYVGYHKMSSVLLDLFSQLIQLT